MTIENLGHVPTSLASSTSNVMPHDADYRQRVTAAAVQFEGMFIAQLMREMRRAGDALGANDDAGGGFGGERAGRDMLDWSDTVVATELASQRAFGIADMIVRQMLPPDGA